MPVKARHGDTSRHITVSRSPRCRFVTAVRICHLAGGDFSTVKILLEESVDLNDTDSTGRTPLMFASGAGHLEATDFDDFDDFGWNGQVGYGQNRP